MIIDWIPCKNWEVRKYDGVKITYPLVSKFSLTDVLIRQWMQTEFTVIGIHPESVNPDDFEYITPPHDGKRYELARGKSHITYVNVYNSDVRVIEELPYDKWNDEITCHS